MKDKLIKIIEAALSNDEMILNGSVIAVSQNFMYQGVSDIKYKNLDIYKYNFDEMIYSVGEYQKFKEIKRIDVSVNNVLVTIRPSNKIDTSDLNIKGSRKSKFEQFVKSTIHGRIFDMRTYLKSLKKEPVILNAKLNTYDSTYVISYKDYTYPIDEEIVNKLYELYVVNLKKARERKPLEELNKLIKKLGIDEA